MFLSGGTATSSPITIGYGSTTANSCDLVNSPMIISGSDELGSLSMSGCQLQSDGSTVPLTIQVGGVATVRASEFQSIANDDRDITMISMDAGGSLNVSQSQLVHVDGRADPFPCNGTLPTCASVHTKPVEINGPAMVTLTSPLVCDPMTGECLSDLCAIVNCGDHGTCEDGLCICHSGYQGETCEQLPCCTSTNTTTTREVHLINVGTMLWSL